MWGGEGIEDERWRIERRDRRGIHEERKSEKWEGK